MKVKSNIIKSLIILFIPVMAGCPYKEVYMSQTKSAFLGKIEIIPKTVFLNVERDTVHLDFGIGLVNKSIDPIKLSLLGTYLENASRKLPIEKISALGSILPPDQIIILAPATDTVIGFNFSDLKINLKDSLLLNLNLSSAGDSKVLYLRRK
ncbi:MAG: hypothetical protein QM768_23580 [Agriterribacter sp.]